MLRNIDGQWQFLSEEILEDFLWENLSTLLNLHPLARQYWAKGDICDIVALDTTGQLVILELKNTEDRGIVQQLTRYYDSLLEQKTFASQVDYSLGIRLIAIAPSFHRHNWIDRKYHKLSIEFIQYKIHFETKEFHLCLEHLDNQQFLQRYPIPFQIEETPPILTPLPEPSRVLKNILSQCNTIEREGILRLREKLLNSYTSMAEQAEAGKVLWGKGSRYCAELRYRGETSNAYSNKQALIFLWLPYVVISYKRLMTPEERVVGDYIFRIEPVRRMLIFTDWKEVSVIRHVKLGTDSSRSPREGIIWGKDSAKSIRLGAKSYGSANMSFYLETLNLADSSLETIINLSIESWEKRISLTKSQKTSDSFDDSPIIETQ